MGDESTRDGLNKQQEPVEQPESTAGGAGTVPQTIQLPGPAHSDPDSRSLAGILNTLRRGILLLGQNGELVYANASAHALIAEADALTLDEWRVQVQPVASQKRLEQYLADRELQAGSLVIPLYRRSSGSELRLVISALDADNTDIPRFLAFIYDPTRSDAIDESLLSQSFQLTATETTIASSIFEGRNIPDIASQLGCSHHTVRVHVKHIFKKCGVHSKAELVRLIALGPRGPDSSRK